MSSRYREVYVPSRRRRSPSPPSRRYRDWSRSSPPRRRARTRYETFDPSTQFRDDSEEKKMTRSMLSDKERDARTIFVWQLASKVTEVDVFDLFSRAGKVRDVRLIMDKRTGKHKGAGYIEFYNTESVPPALALNGELVRNFPVAVKGPEAAETSTSPTTSKKNSTLLNPSMNLSSTDYVLPSIPALIKLLNPAGLPIAKPSSSGDGFTKLYVGSVPFNVTDSDLRTIFEPFGQLKSLNLQKDPLTQKSKGFGFLEYYEHEAAVKALGINGIVVAGRPLRVGLATQSNGSGAVPNDVNGQSVISGVVNANGKVQGSGDVMGELDEGRAGVRMDASRRQALMEQLSGKKSNVVDQLKEHVEPSKFVRIGNMFEAGGGAGAEAGWLEDLTEEVRDECNARFGKVVHMRVEPLSQGCVYVMFEKEEYAKQARVMLQGRWFGGRLLSCVFVSEIDYRQRFQDVPNLQ